MQIYVSNKFEEACYFIVNDTVYYFISDMRGTVIGLSREFSTILSFNQAISNNQVHVCSYKELENKNFKVFKELFIKKFNCEPEFKFKSKIKQEQEQELPIDFIWENK